MVSLRIIAISDKGISAIQEYYHQMTNPRIKTRLLARTLKKTIPYKYLNSTYEDIDLNNNIIICSVNPDFIKYADNLLLVSKQVYAKQFIKYGAKEDDFVFEVVE